MHRAQYALPFLLLVEIGEAEKMHPNEQKLFYRHAIEDMKCALAVDHAIDYVRHLALLEAKYAHLLSSSEKDVAQAHTLIDHVRVLTHEMKHSNVYVDREIKDIVALFDEP